MIDIETLDYDNNRGAITGTVDGVFYFNDTAKEITIHFSNTTRHKRNDLRISSVDMNGHDFFDAPFTDNDDWVSYEDEIQAAINDKESEQEPKHEGYGYNGSDVC